MIRFITNAREYLAETVAITISAGTLWTSMALHGMVPKKGFKPVIGRFGIQQPVLIGTRNAIGRGHFTLNLTGN